MTPIITLIKAMIAAGLLITCLALIVIGCAVYWPSKPYSWDQDHERARR